MTNNLGALTNFAGITFNYSAASYTIIGNDITLGGNITLGTSISTETINLNMTLSANRTIVTNSSTLTLGGVISATAGNISPNSIYGTGTVILSGANTGGLFPLPHKYGVPAHRKHESGGARSSPPGEWYLQPGHINKFRFSTLPLWASLGVVLTTGLPLSYQWGSGTGPEPPFSRCPGCFGPVPTKQEY